ncbi:hypothetical protein ACQEU6_01905 [Spirillospora sp. CA-108201]
MSAALATKGAKARECETAGFAGHVTVLAELFARGARVEGLAGAAAGIQPSAAGVGGGVHVRAVGGLFEEQGGERSGDRAGRFSEPDEELAVLVEEIVDAGGGPRWERCVGCGDRAADEGEPGSLAHRG